LVSTRKEHYGITSGRRNDFHRRLSAATELVSMRDGEKAEKGLGS